MATGVYHKAVFLVIAARMEPLVMQMFATRYSHDYVIGSFFYWDVLTL